MSIAEGADDGGPASAGGCTPGAAVGELGEEALLAAFTPLLPQAEQEVVPSGDDCAVVAAPDGRFCVSTDVLVQGEHFRTDWSTARDIGARAAAQNLADIAAMGAHPTALVVSLVLPRTTPVAWVQDLARGFADACRGTGAGVVGGDLSVGERVVIAVTVHGDLGGRRPVLRSGARAGDVVVHAGTLGRSAAGLALLQAGLDDRAGGWGEAAAAARTGIVSECLAVYRAPSPPLSAGPALADAGATAMLDVSDGLLRDAGRIARASGVVVEIAEPDDASGAGRVGLSADLAALEPVAGMLREDVVAARALARQWVLTGGEDHGLLATFAPTAVRELPTSARVIGAVRARRVGEEAGVLLCGRVPEQLGWDHFRA
ncbi:MAG: thiamine-phosphate kinase [Actinomyces ruminicola]|nr:thiamine-phosphate kinase [Actinomyces ruminicola]